MVNPATGEVIAKVPSSKGPETRAAIASAASVFPKWSGLPAKERSKILRKCACRHVLVSCIVIMYADLLVDASNQRRLRNDRTDNLDPETSLT